MIINKELFIVAKNSVDYNILLEEKLKYSEQENAKMRELLRKSRARSNYSTEKWNKERDELIGNEQGERE